MRILLALSIASIVTSTSSSGLEEGTTKGGLRPGDEGESRMSVVVLEAMVSGAT